MSSFRRNSICCTKKKPWQADMGPGGFIDNEKETEINLLFLTTRFESKSAFLAYECDTQQNYWLHHISK